MQLNKAAALSLADTALAPPHRGDHNSSIWAMTKLIARARRARCDRNSPGSVGVKVMNHTSSHYIMTYHSIEIENRAEQGSARWEEQETQAAKPKTIQAQEGLKS